MILFLDERLYHTWNTLKLVRRPVADDAEHEHNAAFAHPLELANRHLDQMAADARDLHGAGLVAEHDEVIHLIVDLLLSGVNRQARRAAVMRSADSKS